MSFQVPEKYRVLSGRMASTSDYGNNGAFKLRAVDGQMLGIIASDCAGWEHVSISRFDRCPIWDEMCLIKELFWTDTEDCVVQYHPPRSDYVNFSAYCLHLWRPIGVVMPRPPSLMVGPR